VKQRDDAFRAMDHSETARTWQKSSKERKAEVRRKEARVLKEAKKRGSKRSSGRSRSQAPARTTTMS
jgi:hypothetical protein